MTHYAAFLRGINLGRRRLTNDELRVAFSGPPVTDIATYRASGNVVFGLQGGSGVEGADAHALEALLEARLATALEFTTATFVRPLARLTELIAQAEGLFPGPEGRAGFKAHVLFLKAAAGGTVRERFAAMESSDDRFHVTGADIVWMRRGGIHDAPIQPADLVRAVGDDGYTQRTLGTVRGLAAKFA